MASILSTSGSPSTLNLIEAKPSAAPRTTAPRAMMAMASRISMALLVFVQAGEAHEGERHQAGGDHRDGGAAEIERDIGALDAFADAGEQDQYQREADRTAGAEEQRLDEVVAVGDVEQRHAEHGAVGGDQRQVDAQCLLQRRRGL